MWTRMVLIASISLSARTTFAQPTGSSGPPTRHLVSSIDVEDFGAETLRIGDLNGDGAPDLLLVQSVYGTREIGRRQQEKGAWCIATLRINWFGQDKPHGVVVYGHGASRPAVIYDGEIVETFPMAYSPDVAPADRPDAFYAFAADVADAIIARK
jgi:hypothetical protein